MAFDFKRKLILIPLTLLVLADLVAMGLFFWHQHTAVTMQLDPATAKFFADVQSTGGAPLKSTSLDTLLSKDPLGVYFAPASVSTATSSARVYFLGPDLPTFTPLGKPFTVPNQSSTTTSYYLAYYFDKNNVYLFQMHNSPTGDVFYFDIVAGADHVSFIVDSAMIAHDIAHTFKTQWVTATTSPRYVMAATN